MPFTHMKVLQYQELYRIAKSEIDEMDKVTESVAVLTGKTTRQVDEMPVTEFNKLATEAINSFKEEISPKAEKSFEVNGRTYYLLYEPGKLTRGQYVTLQHFLQMDVVENCHYILAALTYDKKTGKHDSDRLQEIADDILDADFKVVYSSCLFFCKLFTYSISNLRGYLGREMKKKGMRKEEVNQLLKNFKSVMDGFTMPKESQSLKE